MHVVEHYGAKSKGYIFIMYRYAIVARVGKNISTFPI